MAGNTVVVHIMGNTRGLKRALFTAQKNILDLADVSNYASRAVAGISIALAATAASGVIAGAAAAAATSAMAAGIGGVLVYFAAKNEEVRNSFTSLKEHVLSTMEQLTDPLVEPLKQFALQAQTAFDALRPSIETIVASLAPLIEQIGDQLLPLAEKLGPMLVSAFESGKGPLMAFVEGLGPLIDGFKNFFDILNTPVVADFFSTFMQALGDLLPVLAELFTHLTPIGILILQALIPAFQNLSDTVQSVVVPVMEWLAQLIADNPGMITKMILAWIAFKTVLIATNSAMAIVKAGMVTMAAIRGVMIAGTGIWTAAQWLLNAAFMGFPLVWIIAAIAAVIAIVVLLVQNWEQVSEFLGTVWNFIKDTAIAVWNAIKAFLVAIWEGIKGLALAAFEGIKNLISNVWNAVKDFTSNVWNNIKSLVSNAINGLKSAISSGMNAAKDTIVNIFNSIISFIAGLPGKFLQMGKDIIQGLINGVGAMAGLLKDAVTSLAKGALNAIKSVFRIGSPSKEMRQIGVWSGQGLIIGLEETEKGVAKASKHLAESAIAVFSDQPMYTAGLSMGEYLARGITDGVKFSNPARNIKDIFNETLGDPTKRLSFDNSALQPAEASIYQVHVQAGISSPEETGRAVVDAISSYEQINGSRWRD